METSWNCSQRGSLFLTSNELVMYAFHEYLFLKAPFKSEANICTYLWEALNLYIFMRSSEFVHIYEKQWICTYLWEAMNLYIFMRSSEFVHIYKKLWVCTNIYWTSEIIWQLDSYLSICCSPEHNISVFFSHV